MSLFSNLFIKKEKITKETVYKVQFDRDGKFISAEVPESHLGK